MYLVRGTMYWEGRITAFAMMLELEGKPSAARFEALIREDFKGATVTVKSFTATSWK